MGQTWRVGTGRAMVAAADEAIAAMKGGSPLAPVTVVVPSNLVGLHLRRTLAGSGRGLANVRFMVPERLAEGLGAAALGRSGRSALPEAVRRETLRAMLERRPGILARVCESESLLDWLDRLARRCERHPDLAQCLELSGGAVERQATELLRQTFAQLTRTYFVSHELFESAAHEVERGTAALEDVGAVVVLFPTPRTEREQRLYDALDARGGLAEVCLEGAAAEAVLPTLMLADDVDSEVRAAAQWAWEKAAAGVPLHRIGLLYPSAPEYHARTIEALRRLEVRFHARAVATLADTGPGRALLGALELDLDDVTPTDVGAWLAACPLAHRGTIAPGEWSRAIRAGRPAPGIDAVARRMRRFESPDLADFLEDLADWRRREPTNWVRLAEWLTEFLERFVSTDSIDEAALSRLERIRERIGALAKLDGCGATVRGRAGSAAREALSEALPPLRRYADGLYVGTAAGAFGLEFDAVCLLGVRDGLFPPPDPLIRIGEPDDLEKAERALRIQAALTCAPEIVFACGLGDAADGREYRPAAAFLEVARQHCGTTISTDELLELEGQPWLHRAPCAARAALKRPLGECEWTVAVPDPECLKAAQDCVGARAGAASGAFDGLAGPASVGEPLSVTALEKYGSCPFQFFLLEELKCGGDDRDRLGEELDPDLFGILAHRTMQRVAEQLSNLIPPSEGWGPWVSRLLAQSAQGFVASGQLRPGKRLDWQLSRLAMRITRFINEVEQGVVPSANLRVEHPLEDSSGPIPLRGRADWVSEQDGLPYVIDFKTGKLPNEGLESGSRLQAALYLKMLGGEGTFTYVGLGKEYDKKQLSAEQAGAATADQWLPHLAASLEAGIFPAVPFLKDPTDMTCRRCNHGRVCAPDKVNAWNRKRSCGNLTPLETWRNSCTNAIDAPAREEGE